MNRRLTIVFLALIATAAAPRPADAQAPRRARPGQAPARLGSTRVVIDASANRAVYAKGADDVTPIASLTKLMTAIVTLDAGLPLDEPIAIDMDDLDYLKGTHVAAAAWAPSCRGAKCCASR